MYNSYYPDVEIQKCKCCELCNDCSRDNKDKHNKIFKLHKKVYDEDAFIEKDVEQKDLHEADAIVLTCMDFRLIDDIVLQMNELGYLDKYDEFILAGASLGYNIETDNHWDNVFKEHVNLAKDLHSIKEIIVIDHMQCGMYKDYYGELSTVDEFIKHKENLRISRDSLNELFPDLKVSLYIIDIEGHKLIKIE